MRCTLVVLALVGYAAAYCDPVKVNGLPGGPGVPVTGLESELSGGPLRVVDLGRLSYHTAGAVVFFPLIQPGAEVEVSCCDVKCEFFISVYHCPPCSTGHDGGLPGVLLAAGWQGGHCAPSFLEKGERFPMTTFHRVLGAGDSEVFVSPTGTSHVVIYMREQTYEIPCQDTRRWAGFVTNSETGGFSCSADTDAQIDARLNNACETRYPGSRAMTGDDVAMNAFTAFSGLPARPEWPMQVACPGCGGCDDDGARKCALGTQREWHLFEEWPRHGGSVLVGGCVRGAACERVKEPWCPPRGQGPYPVQPRCTKCLGMYDHDK